MHEPKLPKRSKRFGVGKEIGGAVYVHRRYESVFEPLISAAKQYVPDGFDYDVVKFRRANGVFTFIQSGDFDSASEPTVGDTLTVDTDGNTRLRKRLADPFIYHHKWLFVDDDYDGFDVEQSKRWSIAWMSLPEVDKSRIGRKSYWISHVLPRLDKASS
jgi:hypothetical protein